MTSRRPPRKKTPSAVKRRAAEDPARRPSAEVARLKAQVAELQAALAEADKREAAAGDVLRLIATSPADVQPVFDAIAERATHLCDALHSTVYRIDDGQMHFIASSGMAPAPREETQRQFPQPLSAFPRARDACERGVVNYVPDVHTAPGVNPVTLERARRFGYHALVNMPMVRDGTAVGLIAVVKAQPASFTDKQIALLQTFADQAVIALENARLFTELQQKNRALTEAHAQVTEALEQQTATAGILRVMSQSPTDAAPVFDAIADSAVRLTGAHYSVVLRFDGTQVELVTIRPQGLPVEAEFRSTYPLPVGDLHFLAPVVTEGRIRHVPDVETDAVSPRGRERATMLGYRSLLQVPMVKDGKVVGVIGVGRQQPGPFTDKQIALLQTFADQAVIAIENVRLFREL